MLVAPVTAPGTVADTTVWIPPGRWTDYFTGATFTGPTTTTVSVPLDRMPVFVRAGGIIPEQAPTSATASETTARHMVLKVFPGTPGSSGSFSLYGDSGTGLGYTSGQSTETRLTDSIGSGVGRGVPARSDTRVTVGSAHGHYPGEPAAVSYQLDMVDLTAPSQVTLNGHRLGKRSSASAAPGWYYQASTATVVVTTGWESTSRSFTVLASGTRSLTRSEPPTG
jgi:hypothetical protein